MNSGYDQYFKNARKAAKVKPPQANQGMSIEDFEKHMNKKVTLKKSSKKKSSIPWKFVGVSFIGLALALAGIQYHQQVEAFAQKIEISLLGGAYAEEPSKASAPQAAPSTETKADTTPAGAANDDLDHLKNLSDRQKELDLREVELVKQEEELAKERESLEKRIKELEEMRLKISSVLDDKVKVDDQKVDTLVQVYSNMKPPQAAKIFETLDEDLAVEILSRMKKKNAAEIMNLLKAEKAQVFSERYAGYKRK